MMMMKSINTKSVKSNSKGTAFPGTDNLANVGGAPKDSAISNAFLPESKISAAIKTSTKTLGPIVTNSLFSMRLFNADQDLPIVYNEQYNISLLGLELLHNSDSKKYAKIAELLSDEFANTPYARLSDKEDPDEPEGDKRKILHYLSPNRAVSLKELSIHHKTSYINKVHNDKSVIARIVEIWLLNLLPISSLKSRLINPMKWQVAGTIFAAHLAMQHGWAINLGGGFHQSSALKGETFCIFSDVMLAIKYIWRKHPLQKFLIIDLDAHQATGIECDILDLDSKKRKFLFMVDIFNDTIHPPNERANRAIDVKVALGRFTGSETYLRRLKRALNEATSRFKPSMVFYIAGQDVLKDDQLGLMNLNDEALVERDELVFSWAIEWQKCPIVMLLGGGYLKRGVKVQVDSIKNLYEKNLIWGGHKSGIARSLSRPRAAVQAEHPGEQDTHHHGNRLSSAKQRKGASESSRRNPLVAKDSGKQAVANSRNKHFPKLN